MPHRSRCKYAATDMPTTGANNEWRGERQGSLGQMRLHLVQGWGCQGLQAMEPMTEPAMTPGDAAPLEEPDAASLGGVAGGGGLKPEFSTTRLTTKDEDRSIPVRLMALGTPFANQMRAGVLVTLYLSHMRGPSGVRTSQDTLAITTGTLI
jgi:hypothetical protein